MDGDRQEGICTVRAERRDIRFTSVVVIFKIQILGVLPSSKKQINSNSPPSVLSDHVLWMSYCLSLCHVEFQRL